MELVPSPHSLEERLVLLEDRYGGEKVCWSHPGYEDEREKLIDAELAKNPILQAIKEGSFQSLLEQKIQVMEKPFKNPSQKNIREYLSHLIATTYFLNELVKVEEPIIVEIRDPDHEIYKDAGLYSLGISVACGVMSLMVGSPISAIGSYLVGVYFLWKSNRHWREGEARKRAYLNEILPLKGTIAQITKHTQRAEAFGMSLFPERYMSETNVHPM